MWFSFTVYQHIIVSLIISSKMLFVIIFGRQISSVELPFQMLQDLERCLGDRWLDRYDRVYFIFILNNAVHVGCSFYTQTTYKVISDMQALAAASKSVDFLKLAHSLHAYFLRIGDLNSKHVYVYFAPVAVYVYLYFLPLHKVGIMKRKVRFMF